MQAKIVLCGEGLVGKSTIRERYLGIAFRPAYLQTIGADYATKNQEYEPGQTIRLQIWDLAGQQKFSNIREAFYKGTDGAVLVYDVTNPSTAEKIVDWIKEIKKIVNDNIPMVLVGNKFDLRSETETLSTNEGQMLAEELSKANNMDIMFIESSAKTGENIENIFQTIAKSIIEFDSKSLPQQHNLSFEKYFNDIKNFVHLYFYKMTQIGPSCISQTMYPRDQALLIKMGVFYSTTLGQGTTAHDGLFGPVPIPESKDTQYKDLESVIYSFHKADKNHHDPRAKGINFCFIVATIAKDLLFQFNNVNAILRFFISKLEPVTDVEEITDEYLSNLKKDLLRDVFILNNQN